MRGKERDYKMVSDRIGKKRKEVRESRASKWRGGEGKEV